MNTIELTFAPGHGSAQRNTHQKGKRHGHHAEFDGDWSLLGNDLRNGCTRTVTGGGTQITVGQVNKKIPQLHRDRVIQTQLFQLCIDGRLISFLKIVKITFDGHLSQQHKNHCDNDAQRDQGRCQTLKGILQHKRSQPLSGVTRPLSGMGVTRNTK